MSQGNLADYIASYPGNPSNVSTSIFDCKPGTIVFDSTSLGAYRKISPLGDNTVYGTLGHPKAWSEDFLAAPTAANYTTLTTAGAAAVYTPAGTANLINTPKGNVLNAFPLGTTQTVSVAPVANGMDIKGNNVSAALGWEIAAGILGATGRPFVIGVDPAFYMTVKFSVATVANLTRLLAGFRTVEVANAAYTGYSSFGGIGIEAAVIKTFDKTASAVTTTQSVTAINTVPLTVKTLVSATGVVTYQHDFVTAGTLAAPAATTAYTLTDGAQVIPFIFFVSGGATGEVAIRSIEVGYQ